MTNVGPTPTGNIFLDTIDIETDPNLPSPTSQIFGSSSGLGNANGVPTPGVPTNEERADALFPFFDGTDPNTLAANPVSLDGTTEYLFPGDTVTMSLDADANGNPLTPVPLFQNSVEMPGPADIPVEDFFSFHTAHQLQFVKQFGTDIPGGGKNVRLTQGGNQFDIVSSPDGRRIFILQQLTKADVAIASVEDQEALAAALGELDATERATLENVIGAQVGTAGSTVRATLEAAIAAAITQIDSVLFNDDEGKIAPFSQDEITAARNTFKDQILNIGLRAETSAFINQAEINTRIADITRRAERASAFFITSVNPPFAADGGLKNINSLEVSSDGLRQPLIENAFKSFIAQETRIRDLDNQRLQLAQTGFLNGGRALDGPNLIAIFQLNYNLVREAEVNSETEELTQQNALLRDYAALQQLINDALSQFSSGEDGAEEERNILGSTNDDQDFDQVDLSTRNKISFVEDLLTDPDNIRHPIETLRGIERPTFDLVRNSTGKLNLHSQNQLNIFASQLSDTVTQINQESQILTNEISNLNRERNRHFDLANNALRRLNDSLQTIARI